MTVIAVQHAHARLTSVLQLVLPSLVLMHS